MDGVILTPLKKITHVKGDIFHAMKKSEKAFSGFGEAYFSSVYQGKIKGWKKHNKMTLNIIVVKGEIDKEMNKEDKALTRKLKETQLKLAEKGLAGDSFEEAILKLSLPINSLSDLSKINFSIALASFSESLIGTK